MPAIRGITVAVGDHYARTLDICLMRNMRHLTSCLVITTPDDEAVKAVVAKVPGASLYETNEFYAYGARFNKGVCVERGFDILGRHGFLLIFDADILLPDSLPLDRLRPDCLHGARRRVLEDPAAWHPGLDWSRCPVLRDGREPVGFFQLWDCDSPSVRDKRPWYDVSFAHAGGSDAAFLALWPPGKRVVLPLDVLHLGPVDRNWFGTSPEARDLMAKYVHQNQWPRAMKNFTAEDAARAGALPGRVSVPGYAPSAFELPFERRARDARGGGG